MQKVLILSKFTNPSNFDKSKERIQGLISAWEARSINITETYFAISDEFDTVLIAEGDLEAIYNAVKRLEIVGSVKCSIKPIFPVFRV